MYKLKLLFPLIFTTNISRFIVIVATKDNIENVGQPLYLSKYIKSGQYKEAQTLATVNKTLFKGVQSFSGYLTVDEKSDSHLFFWYFPAEKNRTGAPLVLWLQGGPGSTMMVGVFLENGPFRLENDHTITKRTIHWSSNHNIIYIDNPVGTGYSRTKDGYAKNQTQIGAQLYEALLQFLQMFPDRQKNDFYVVGESYAGKYIPALCYTIHQKNPNATLKINLLGSAIGNGLIDPVNQLNFSDYLYQTGLVDASGKKVFEQVETKCVNYIVKKQWQKAFEMYNKIIGGYLNQTSLFTNYTGFTNHQNYLFANASNKIAILDKYIQRGDVRKAIHVGNATWDITGTQVQINLINEFMQSVAPWIVELLANYRLLLYNGQLDITVSYPSTENFLEHLSFSGANEYKQVKRQKWKVDGDIAGYVKMAGNLTTILVRNAGLMVPQDQPKWAHDMITRFTHKFELWSEPRT